MPRLDLLLDTVRALSGHAQVHFLPVPDRDDIWVVRILVGSVVIIETAAGPVHEVVDQALARLSKVSFRMMEAAKRRGD